VSAALDRPDSTRLRLLIAQVAEHKMRRPVFERLREKVGGELARKLLRALVGNQRRSARRG
jgi:hypothetical protein